MTFVSARTTVRILGTLVLCFGLLSLTTIPGHAGSGDEGSAGAVFLKLDPTAESAGAGSAGIAGARHIPAIQHNPAGLSRMRHSEASFTQFDMIADITYNHLATAVPVSRTWGGFGFSATSLDYGDLDRTTINSNNNPARDGTFGADDLALAGSYGLPITDSVSFGATYKYIRQEIAEFESTTQAFDLGVNIRSPVEGLQFGVAARNLGGDVKFLEKSDPLPTTYGAGVHYRTPVRWGSDRLQLNGEFLYAEDAEPHLSGGLEYTIEDLVSLRAGYNGAPDVDDGLTLGGGFHIRGFQIDYAFVPMGGLGDNQRLTLSYEFGHWPHQLTEEDPRPELRDMPEPYKHQIEPELNPATVKEEQFIQPEELYEWKNAMELGKQAYLDGNFEQARKQFLKVQQMRPNLVRNIIWLGIVEHKLGMEEEARGRFYRALELDPNNGVARRNLQRITE